jgi:hypothetical protein
MRRAILFICWLAACSWNGGAAELYVSPGGADSNPGTKERPLATLEGARNAVRGLIANSPKENITVWIRGGTYRLRKTVVFGLEDSAPLGRTITYQAYAGEEPIFTSAVPVTGWKRPSQGHIWVADIPPGLSRILTLYDGETRLSRARSKGFALTRPGDRETLYFPPGAIKNWNNLDDIELLIIPQPWTMNILPLASVDASKGVAKTAVPATYPLGTLPTWFHQPLSAWIENSIDFLDQPGEWVVNSHERKIYYWPRNGEPGSDVQTPCLRELVRVEGKIDRDGPQDTPVRNLVFRGLTFMHGERDLWPRDHLGWGVQHDWEIWDRDTALLRFRGAQNCLVDACRFANTGGTAIRLDLYCQRNRLQNNLIEHVGNMGILLAGYGPGKKDVNRRNAIIDNHLHYLGELYWHGHGIFLWQSGENQVAHNLIHNGPRKALGISGVRDASFSRERQGAECSRTIRWDEVKPALDGDDWRRFISYLHARNNVVEYNEAYAMLEKLGDGAVFNVSGAGEGNVIRRNYIHHIFNKECAGVMRTDGWQSGTVFEENILYESDLPGVMHKNFNHVVNNFFINLRAAITYNSFPGEPPNYGSRIERNIFWLSGANPAFHFLGGPHLPGASKPTDCETDYNLFFSPDNPEGGRQSLRKWQEQGIEKHGKFADPMFVDVTNGDFRLKPGSPALGLGIQAIDVRQIGLTADFPKRFPSREQCANSAPRK